MLRQAATLAALFVEGSVFLSTSQDGSRSKKGRAGPAGLVLM
jgi:hypothetical protein